MPKFLVPVTLSYVYELEIDADSLEEAIAEAEDTDFSGEDELLFSLEVAVTDAYELAPE